MQHASDGPEAPLPTHRDLIGRAILGSVNLCSRFAWLVIIVSLAVAVAGGYYTATHFAINANTNEYISAKLPWREHAVAMDSAFPQRNQLQILVVINATTPELAGNAATKLAKRLKEEPQLFALVERPDGGPYFDRNAFLFQPVPQLEASMTALERAEPFLATLTADPSSRGIMTAFSFIPKAVQSHRAKFADFTPQMTELSRALAAVLAGRPSFFSWQSLFSGHPPTKFELQRFVIVEPILDYSALQPGQAATNFIQKSADALGLVPAKGVRVRITGPVPVADQEFSTVQEGWDVSNAIAGLIVLVIIWWALKSIRIVFAVGLTVAIGLAITAAVGLLLVKALTLISIAFAVLFVGIGADFGIQYSMRYRSERHHEAHVTPALRSAALKAGRPLALAATAAAAGFYSFLPTDYRGVSELGLIAGTGMIVAFLGSISLLPALLSVLGSPTEPKPIGFKFLAPADRFLTKHRHAIVVGTLIAVLASTPLLMHLNFDFNPFDLSNPKNESVKTLRALMQEPGAPVNRIEVLAPSLAATGATEEKLRTLPQVAQVLTLKDLVPTDQDQKLTIIHKTAARLLPLFDPRRLAGLPSAADDIAAMKEVAAQFATAADNDKSPGGKEARRLATLLQKLAVAPSQKQDAARAALLPSLYRTLDLLHAGLEAKKTGLADIPESLRRDWISPSGQARIEIVPKGNPNDNAFMTKFVDAVMKVAPDASGEPVAIQESGRTVVRAFIEAGIFALLSIAILLFVVLRRISDVLLTLVPLLVAAIITLEITAVIHMPLNFVNIIAFPLLLGLGVAFKIYFIMAWRAGTTNLLQSSLTRAVFFSAMTTATAFGSLWLSHDPGLSSMGKLLAISLLTTMAAAVLFQPALMGPPRQRDLGPAATDV